MSQGSIYRCQVTIQVCGPGGSFGVFTVEANGAYEALSLFIVVYRSIDIVNLAITDVKTSGSSITELGGSFLVVDKSLKPGEDHITSLNITVIIQAQRERSKIIPSACIFNPSTLPYTMEDSQFFTYVCEVIDEVNTRYVTVVLDVTIAENPNTFQATSTHRT